MKKLALLLVIMSFQISWAQLSFRKELITSKCELYSIMQRGQESLTYIKSEAAAINRKLPDLTMSVYVFDTTKAETKKMFRNLKFKKKDTVLVYGWDKEILLFPFHKSACKFEYYPGDSVLVFEGIQKIWMDENAPESRFTSRRFKMLSQTADEFVLRDMDIYDVNRDYYFKKTKIKAPENPTKKTIKKP